MGLLSYIKLFTGNVFVIAAIILERNLQNVANYLVASLAVADLFVACLVMPLGAVYEVSTSSLSLCTERNNSLLNLKKKERTKINTIV